MWNGTAETLNAKPATTNTTARLMMGTDSPVVSASAMPASWVVPATPYSSDMP